MPILSPEVITKYILNGDSFLMDSRSIINGVTTYAEAQANFENIHVSLHAHKLHVQKERSLALYGVAGGMAMGLAGAVISYPMTATTSSFFGYVGANVAKSGTMGFVGGALLDSYKVSKNADVAIRLKAVEELMRDAQTKLNMLSPVHNIDGQESTLRRRIIK